jgi:hypothetical protein
LFNVFYGNTGDFLSPFGIQKRCASGDARFAAQKSGVTQQGAELLDP